MGIIQNFFKRKKDNALIDTKQETYRISDEEAIENAKLEIQYYNKAKAVEKVVIEILTNNNISIPPTFSTDDYKMKIAKNELEIRGLSLPDAQLDEILITKEDIEAGLHRAWIGIDALLEYYGASQEMRNNNTKIFDKMIKNDIPIKYNSNLEQSSHYFAQRYAIPELFFNPMIDNNITSQNNKRVK